MKRIWLLVVTLVLLLGLNGCGKEHDIRIQVPAGQQEEFVFSDTQIRPKGNKITIRQTEHFGDCEVVIRRVTEDGNVVQRNYLTPGISTKLECEKNIWYNIGIHWNNPSTEPQEVGLTVSGVEVQDP